MSFLAPLFLIGALAVAGPLVFHLIRRSIRERTAFSAVMFLRPTRPRLTHRSRLEHLLLLLLRCGAIALLALGFSRPFFRNVEPSGAPAADARRMVVLVDASASMRRAGFWDDARRRASEALRTVGPGDEAALYLFSRGSTALVTFDEWKAAPAGQRVPMAEARLAAAAPGWEEDRMGEALVGAAETLAAADSGSKAAGPRQIVLISDMKTGSRLDSLQGFEWPKNIELKTVPLKARNPGNAGVHLVADAPGTDRPESAGVRVRVNNAADSKKDQFQVGWVPPAGDGFLGPAVDVYVPAGQARVVTVPQPAGGSALRRIALRGDDEDFDNSVWLIPPQRPRWTVLYFGGEKADDIHAPRFFLQRALQDTPHLTIRFTAHDPSEAVPPAEMEEAKMFVATGAPGPELAAALHAQMLAGKTAVFVPRNAQGGAALGRMLELPAVGMEEVQASDYAMFGAIDFRHPLFLPFADPAYSDFTKIRIWKYRRLAAEAIPGARVIARFDSGDPAIVEVGVGVGRLILMLTGWNPEDSQLAVSSKFVPLVYSLLDLAGGSEGQPSQYSVGDAIPLPWPAGSAVTVRKPDRTDEPLPAGATRFDGSAAPGIYRFESGGRSFEAAVNVAPSESRTEPLAMDELERYGAPGPRDAAEPVRQARHAALLKAGDAESRQKLWRWLLVAALAVLLVESALAGWTSRGGGDRVSPENTFT